MPSGLLSPLRIARLYGCGRRVFLRVVAAEKSPESKRGVAVSHWPKTDSLGCAKPPRGPSASSPATGKCDFVPTGVFASYKSTRVTTPRPETSFDHQKHFFVLPRFRISSRTSQRSPFSRHPPCGKRRVQPAGTSLAEGSRILILLGSSLVILQVSESSAVQADHSFCFLFSCIPL